MTGTVVGAQTESAALQGVISNRFAPGLLALTAATIASVAMMSQASAQSFNQVIVFGDSTVDSGFYKVVGNPRGGAGFNSAFTAAIAAGGTGAPTSGGGLMNPQVLASYFGLTANPANQPGGTNFATSGAKDTIFNNATNGGFGAAIPTAIQMSRYLAGNGGLANSNGLYLISSGGNDVAFAFGGFPTSPTTQTGKVAYLVDQANLLSSAISRLASAGARTIIVPDQTFSFPTNPLRRQAELAYSQALWSGLAAKGVNFIPADFNAVRLAIAANPSQFGFQFIGTTPAQTACTNAGFATAYALLCTSDVNSPVHLKTPDAGQTHLFADDEHLAAGGQKIQADYYYSLVVAPTQISLLAENAVQSRTVTVAGIQDQIGISRQRRTAGFNVWINGDVSSLKINPAPGFPGDSSTPLSGTVALDYKWINGYLLGAAFTTGGQTPSFDLGGSFKQNEIAGSVYGGYVNGPAWASVIATYGALQYDVNRIVPIGITLQGNSAKTNGSNLSFAFQGGYEFVRGNLTHGPVAGAVWQRAKIDGFTETGGFTALSFDDQTRNSVISSIGYKASYDLGSFSPFAQVLWNHEFAGRNRTVTASLTTIEAPSFRIPAVLLGQNWGTGTVGTTMRLGAGFTGLASFTAQAGQTGVTTYGGRVGLNYMIN
jgi:outer membrane lipase/esterase